MPTDRYMPTPERLRKAVLFADRRMQGYRAARTKMLRQFAGPMHNGVDGEREALNTLFSLAETFLAVMGIDPKIEVQGKRTRFNGFASTIELGANEILARLRMSEFVERAILDSLFGCAISYTILSAGAWLEVEGFENGTGEPEEYVVENISLDKYIPDPFAMRRDAMRFEGHRFTLPREWAMDQKDLFNRELLEKLPILGRDVKPAEGAAGLSRPEGGEDDRCIDEIEVVGQYIPAAGLIVGLPGDLEDNALDGGYLWERECKSPGGPYDSLGFMPMPDSAAPVAHMGVVYDLHRTMNALADTIRQQAEAYKELMVYAKGSEKDADAARTAENGYWVGVRDPNFAQAKKVGGVDPNAFRVVDWFQQWHNRLAGNQDAIGGLQTQSQTLGQDQLLAQSAGAKIAWWKGKTLMFLRSICEKVVRFLWNDPYAELEMEETLSGLELPTPRVFSPGQRVGRFEDYEVLVRPYGLTGDSPDARYARIMDWSQKVLIPLAPLMMQQGQAVDVRALAEVAGDLGDIPRLNEIIRPALPQADPAAAMGGPGTGEDPRATTQPGRMPMREPAMAGAGEAA